MKKHHRITFRAMFIAMVIAIALIAQATVAYGLTGYTELTGGLKFGATTVNGAKARTVVLNHPYIAAVYGTGGWNPNGSYSFNTVDYRAAFDSPVGDGLPGPNYFDGAKTGYAGVEFKTPQIVTSIAYMARQGYNTNRLVGAYFQGSNDGANYTTLFKIDKASTGSATYRSVADGLVADKAYKYFRIVGHTGMPDVMNIAELKLYTGSGGGTLNYDANGGAGAPPEQTGIPANTFAPISSIIPVRDGYRFLGWATFPSAVNAPYQPGGGINIGNSSNITLYAVWEYAITTPTYTLFYNANGGSGAPPEQMGIPANTFAPISSIIPVRNSYRFLGWATYPSATSAPYQPDGGINIGNSGNITLYAVWEYAPAPVTTYSIFYNANGGSIAPPAHVGIPENTFVPISPIEPVRAGYIFLGWATSPAALNAIYQPGNIVYIGNASITLYAVWEQQTGPQPSKEQIVTHGRTRYYNAAGTEVTGSPVLGQNAVVSVEKNIAATAVENEFDLTLTVKTSVDISEVTTSADAAVVLVLDISGSMGGINDSGTDYMPALRASAQNFINSLAAEAGDSARYVALVSFETDAKILYGWTDITNDRNRQTINMYIQNLPGVGATFMQGGLQLARNLMRTDALPLGRNNTIIDNRSVVLFSDGEANKYNVLTNEARYNTDVMIQGTAGPGNGFDPAAISLTETMADVVKNQTTFQGYSKFTSYLYTIAFGSEAPTNWLRTTIATNPTYAYTSINAGDLNAVFAAIAKRIESWANAWIVTDPMGENIEFISNIPLDAQASGLLGFQDGILSWDLRKAPPDSLINDIYTYTYTYRIRLDTASANFVPQTAYPTNKPTQLTYVMVVDGQIISDILVADLAIPTVRGFAGPLTFTKVGDNTTPLFGCGFTLTNRGKAGHSLSAASAVGAGEVSFAGIPSGHTYTLAETFMPAAYEGRYQKSDETFTVQVSYGDVTVADSAGNPVDLADFSFNNPSEGRTVIGYVAPMAGEKADNFLKKHDIVVELRTTFNTPAPAGLSTLAVRQPDGMGKFTFENVPFGEYVLYIYRPGFLTRAMMVTISASDPLIVELTPPNGPIFDIWYGDCNGDGRIDNEDVLMVLELAALGVNSNSPIYNPACDLNADGVIDELDVSLILQMWGKIYLDYPGAENVNFFI